jgi:hypothetical protein
MLTIQTFFRKGRYEYRSDAQKKKGGEVPAFCSTKEVEKLSLTW